MTGRKELEALVLRFREGLETLDRSNWGVAWAPPDLDGICNVAHNVLARILSNKLGLEPLIVRGEKFEPYRTHSWLVVGDITIDITGDKEKAIITDMPESHADWENRREDAIVLDPWWRTNCGQAYEDISRFLDGP